jgi:hypothetical protein
MCRLASRYIEITSIRSDFELPIFLRAFCMEPVSKNDIFSFNF